LLRKINHLGLRSRTLVVLTGFAPDYFSAQTGRNGPMRVPLVVNFEGHTSEGMRDHHPVDIMDIMPTFLQLADVPSPVHLDGQSFWPLIHKHATKDMRAQAQRQAQNRPLLHYCRDTAVGMSKGDYTLLLEEGDGTHSCGGRQLVPPRLCNRATDPHCKDWIALGPSMDQDMGLIASAMLDAWQPQHEHVLQDDTGARKTTAWPVWSNYPCCGDTCTCARDVHIFACCRCISTYTQRFRKGVDNLHCKIRKSTRRNSYNAQCNSTKLDRPTHRVSNNPEKELECMGENNLK